MLTAITNIDAAITDFVFTLPHPIILNYFFGFFAVRGITLAIWFLIFAYLIFFEEKRHKRFIVYFILALVISTLAFTSLKQIIKRERPLNRFKIYDLRFKNENYPQDYSFPSGHATISFAMATILSAFDKKRKKYFYLIAVLIAFSRIYLGYHYVSDVIIGAVLGWLISWTLLIKLKMRNEKVTTTA